MHKGGADGRTTAICLRRDAGSERTAAGGHLLIDGPALAGRASVEGLCVRSDARQVCRQLHDGVGALREARAGTGRREVRGDRLRRHHQDLLHAGRSRRSEAVDRAEALLRAKPIRASISRWSMRWRAKPCSASNPRWAGAFTGGRIERSRFRRRRRGRRLRNVSIFSRTRCARPMPSTVPTPTASCSAISRPAAPIRGAICPARPSSPACRTTSSRMKRRMPSSTAYANISWSRPTSTCRRSMRRLPTSRRCSLHFCPQGSSARHPAKDRRQAVRSASSSRR